MFQFFQLENGDKDNVSITFVVRLQQDIIYI